MVLRICLLGLQEGNLSVPKSLEFRSRERVRKS